jgi:hypothetical protein
VVDTHVVAPELATTNRSYTASQSHVFGGGEHVDDSRRATWYEYAAEHAVVHAAGHAACDGPLTVPGTHCEVDAHHPHPLVAVHAPQLDAAAAHTAVDTHAPLGCRTEPESESHVVHAEPVTQAVQLAGHVAAHEADSRKPTVPDGPVAASGHTTM